MDKKRLKQLIKNEFKIILCPIGFISKSDTLFVRLSKDNVLHIVNFDLGSIGFTCSVAIQPLYTFDHTEVISLNMGARLSRFKIVQKEWWSYIEPEKGLSEIKELLLKNGLPWFNEYGTPDGIIEFIATGKVNEYGLKSFDAFHQEHYLAFSLFYTGHLEDGVKHIEKLVSMISSNSAEFIIAFKDQLLDVVSKITSDNYKLVLNSIAESNKNAIKMGS